MSPAGFRAGAARVDVTPRLPAPMAGYPTIHVSDDGPQDHRGYHPRTGPCAGVADPLYARALAVDDGTAVAVLLALDLCIVPASFTRRVRDRVSAGYGVPADAVLIVASHNHSGPDYTGHWEPVDPSVPALVEDLAVAAIGEALARRRPATVGLGNGRLDGLTINRRDPARPVDPGVAVLRIDPVTDEPHADPIAVVYGFACHPVSVGSGNRLMSGEYPGAASRVVESAFAGGGGPGAVALFVNGGAGNINPRAFPYHDGHNVVLLSRGLDHDEAAALRSLGQGRRFGTVLGGEVVRVAAGIGCGPGRVAAQRIDVEAELKRGDVLEAFLSHMPHAPHVVEGWRRASTLVTEVAALRIGPLALLGIPGEPFVEIALGLQRPEPTGGGPAIRVAGYANDYPGYLSPPEQYGENRYESVATPLSPAGAQAVIEAATRLRDHIDAA